MSRRIAREGYIATVHILIEAEGYANAFDAVSEALRNTPAFADWAYPTRADEPRQVWIADDYAEGDLFYLLRNEVAP